MLLEIRERSVGFREGFFWFWGFHLPKNKSPATVKVAGLGIEFCY
jgi:hypothetical protein